MTPLGVWRLHAEHVVDRPDVEAPRGVEPTGTNSRTATHTITHTGWQEQASPARQGDTLHVTWINPSVASTIRSPTRHDPPREHVETRSRGMYNTRFAAAMAQGRRPDPFRTRKLRPGTAMVLHPEGCGRVARRRTNTPRRGRDATHAPPPPFIPTHPHKVLTVHAPWRDHLTSIQSYCMEFQHQRPLFPSGYTLSPSSLPLIAMLRVPSRIPLLEPQISNHRFHRVTCI